MTVDRTDSLNLKEETRTKTVQFFIMHKNIKYFASQVILDPPSIYLERPRFSIAPYTALPDARSVNSVSLSPPRSVGSAAVFQVARQRLEDVI